MHADTNLTLGIFLCHVGLVAVSSRIHQSLPFPSIKRTCLTPKKGKKSFPLAAVLRGVEFVVPFQFPHTAVTDTAHCTQILDGC